MRHSVGLAASILMAGIAGMVLAQSPGDPNHSSGRTTGKQATQDDSLWKKPNLPPPPGGGNPAPSPPAPQPSTPPSAPARPCPQYPQSNSVPDSLLGQPIQRGVTADALGAFSIEGDQSYQDMVLCDLDRIQGNTGLGGPFLSNLASELSKRGNRVVIRNKGFLSAGPHTQPGDGSAKAWIMASDPALTAIYRSEPMKIPLTSTFLILESPLDPSQQAAVRGQGTGAILYIDPTQFPLRNSHQTPGHVALFHELVHAWHFAIGKGNLAPYVNAAGSVDPQWVSVEEFDTIAAANWQFTENAYRRTLPLPDRTCVSASCF